MLKIKISLVDYTLKKIANTNCSRNRFELRQNLGSWTAREGAGIERDATTSPAAPRVRRATEASRRLLRIAMGRSAGC